LAKHEAYWEKGNNAASGSASLPAGVHEIIATIPDLSNILVTAFAARRQILMLSAVASLTIIGREEDAEALRLLEFADRNRPVRRPCSYPSTRVAFTCFAADPIWPRPCRST
jgi:hypothetical protein